MTARSWILGIPSMAVIALAGLRFAFISRAGIGESCYQNPELGNLPLPSAGWTTDGAFSFFPIGVQCSYFTSEHELLLVHTQTNVWDWGITFAAILGILGFVLFLTARLATRRSWHIRLKNETQDVSLVVPPKNGSERTSGKERGGAPDLRDGACRLPVSPLCALFCCASSAHASPGRPDRRLTLYELAIGRVAKHSRDRRRGGALASIWSLS